MLMKKNKWLILFLFIFFGCTSGINEYDANEFLNFGITIPSEGDCFPQVKDKYIYPIVPGTKEWKRLKSHDDAIKVCQLPAKKLKSISTSGLIDALIHAPLFTSLDGISNYYSELIWRSIYGYFNSGIELFNRKDAGEALVAYYKLTSLVCVVDNNDALLREYDEFSAKGIKKEFTEQDAKIIDDFKRLQGLECLFTVTEILDKLSHEKKKEAVAVLLANFSLRPDFTYSIFPIAYLMLADKYEPVVEHFTNNVEFQHIINGYLIVYQIDVLISFANDFINVKN